MPSSRLFLDYIPLITMTGRWMEMEEGLGNNAELEIQFRTPMGLIRTINSFILYISSKTILDLPTSFSGFFLF